jgi:hypothetical protein
MSTGNEKDNKMQYPNTPHKIYIYTTPFSFPREKSEDKKTINYSIIIFLFLPLIQASSWNDFDIKSYSISFFFFLLKKNII